MTLQPCRTWSDYDGFQLWFYGSNSGLDHRIELKGSGDNAGASNRFEWTFNDNTMGWRLLQIPFDDFMNRTDFTPGPDPTAPLDTSEMWGYSVLLAPGSGMMKLDEIAVFGNPIVDTRAALAADSYMVDEGAMVTVEVVLNQVSAETVTVDYATADDSADSSDYNAAAGTVTFDPGDTTKEIVIATLDDDDSEGNETFTLALSNPVSATLGNVDMATITIVDNEEPPAPNPNKGVIVDDFENGLPMGTDGDGLDIGFVTWSDGSPVAIATTTTGDAAIDPVPGKDESNNVMELTSTIAGWGGFSHAFANEMLDTWTPMNWSSYEGIAFWYHGTGTGTLTFVDVAENRNPGSTMDDAERWSYEWNDDTAGWQYIEIRFDEMFRKEIGNGAPNDGWNGLEVHAWAMGTTSTGGNEEMRYVDDFSLMTRVTVVDDFESGLPTGMDGDGLGIGFVTWQDGGSAPVMITTTATMDAAIDPVPGKDGSNNVIELTSNISAWGGFSHAFENAAVDTWVPMDWSSYEGNCFWYYGTGSGTLTFVDVAENRAPGSTTDDAERWSYEWNDDTAGWQFIQIAFEDMFRKEIGNGAPQDGWTGSEVHAWAMGTTSTGGNTEMRYVDDFSVYGQSGSSTPLEVEFGAQVFEVTEGDTATISVTLNMTSEMDVTVMYRSAESYATPDRDFTPFTGSVVVPAGMLEATFTMDTIEDGKFERNENLMLYLTGADNASLGFASRTVVTIVNDDMDDEMLLDDFEGWHPFEVEGDISVSITEIMSGTTQQGVSMEVPGQGTWEQVMTVDYAARQPDSYLRRTAKLE